MDSFDDAAISLLRRCLEGTTKKIIEDDIGVASDEASAINKAGWDAIVLSMAGKGYKNRCEKCGSLSHEIFCDGCLDLAKKNMREIIE